MTSVMNAQVKCPYCGMNNRFKHRGIGSWQSNVTCDIDNGGCDRTFVVRYRIVVQTKVHKIGDPQETKQFPEFKKEDKKP